MTVAEPASLRRILRIALAVLLAGLTVAAAVTAIAGTAPLSPTPTLFLALLITELVLIDLMGSAGPRVARLARAGVIGVPLAAALGVRAAVALGTPDLLEWDETYYFSQAVTGADGRGLYPYVFGHRPMPILGSTGHLAWTYALAVKIAGPSLVALRAVSLAASLGGLAFLFLGARRLYGSPAAWMTTALTATLTLFALSNSIRMDTVAFAVVAAGLLAVIAALQDRRHWPWHLGAGLVFGLGLQAHLDTMAAAGACGLLYLALWWRDRRVPGGQGLSPLLGFGAGWFLGAVAFVIFNILPDPDAFFSTTANVRIDAASSLSGSGTSLVRSFLDPRVLAAKEWARYRAMWGAMPWYESAVWLAAVVAVVVRRSSGDRFAAPLVAGTLACAAVVLNNESLLYFTHVVPALALPLGALFVFGVTRRTDRAEPGRGRLCWVAFAIVASALTATLVVRAVERPVRSAAEQADAARFAAEVRAVTSPRCVIAGDGDLYVRYFPDYPLFISLRETEVTWALLVGGARDEAEYWRLKSPDVVASRAPLSQALAAYVTARGLSPAGEGLWLDRARCPR